MKKLFQKQSVSPDNPKFIVWLLVFIFSLILCCALQSCNVEKAALRKDAKAVDRVKGSRTLIDKIAPIVNDLFPCNNDTIFKVKSDTTVKYDTTHTLYFSTDSIYKVDTLKIKISKTITIHDTVKVVTDSKQRDNIDRQTIATLTNDLSAANQAVISANEATKKADIWLWWFIGSCILLVASNGIWIYSKIKI